MGSSTIESLVRLDVDELQQFTSSLLLVKECTTDRAGNHHSILLRDSPALHAIMGSLEYHRASKGGQYRLDVIGDTLGQPLLILQPAGMQVEQPCKFTDSDNPVYWNVGYVGLACEW